MLLLPCLKLRQLTVFDLRQTHILCNIIYLKIVCTTWSVLTEQIEAPHLICLLLELVFAATEKLLLIYSHFIFNFPSSFSPFSLFPCLHTNISTSEKRETLHLVFIMLISLSPALPSLLSLNLSVLPLVPGCPLPNVCFSRLFCVLVSRRLDHFIYWGHLTETDSFQAPQEYLLNKTHKGAQPKCNNFIPTLHPLKSQTALQSRQCLSWYQLYVFDFLIKTSPRLTACELALKKRAKGQLEGKSVWHFPKGLLLQLQR